MGMGDTPPLSSVASATSRSRNRLFPWVSHGPEPVGVAPPRGIEWNSSFHATLAPGAPNSTRCAPYFALQSRQRTPRFGQPHCQDEGETLSFLPRDCVKRTEGGHRGFSPASISSRVRDEILAANEGRHTSLVPGFHRDSYLLGGTRLSSTRLRMPSLP